MIHPDDVSKVRAWEIYGPTGAEIPRLVADLAETGMRLAEIEALIEQVLRRELADRTGREP
jgi:hypothetical protein